MDGCMSLFLVILYSGFSFSHKTTKQEFLERLKADNDIVDDIIEYLSRQSPYNFPDSLSSNKSLQENILNANVLEIKRSKEFQVLVAKNTATNGGEDSKEETSLYVCQKVKRYSPTNPQYIEYEEGDVGSRIIIVAGHGGVMLPKGVQTRGPGCLVNGKCVYRHDCENKKLNITQDPRRCETDIKVDMFTRRIAGIVADEIYWSEGKRPHFIVNNLHRRVLDVNRRLEQGAFHVKDMEAAWKQFHGFIEKAKQNLLGKPGMIFDIHGNVVPERWNMIGYGLLPDDIDNETITNKSSSIDSLVTRAKVPFDQMVRGAQSLGHYLEQKGYKVVPSTRIKHARGRNYFRGDYTVREHGSNRDINGGNVDAVQVEIHREWRKESTHKKFAKDLAQAILKFVRNNYEYKIEIVT